MPNISRSKANQTLKLGEVIEYNNRNIFFQKSCRKWGRRLAPDHFLFFKKVLCELKANGLQLSFNHFRQHSNWKTVKRYYFPSAPVLGPRPHLLFNGPRSKLLFCSPHVSKLLFHGPKWSKLLIHGHGGRKHLFFSVLSKFQTFQLKEDKICNYSQFFFDFVEVSHIHSHMCKVYIFFKNTWTGYLFFLVSFFSS